VCHALLQDPKFFTLLMRIDHELADQTRVAGCCCGGALHRADYPRKPRGCPAENRIEYSSRLSFCCARCRKRWTSRSVRFMGRRVYGALAMVLVSARRAAASSAAAAELGAALGASRRTVQRWRAWWLEEFPETPLWRAVCARFMPPVAVQWLPASLVQAMTGTPPEVLARLLVLLSPLTICRPGAPAGDHAA
jgi:transposase-like protein